MPAPYPHRSVALKAIALRFWATLCAAAAIEVMLFVLFAAGEVQSGITGCGYRFNWTEATYSTCSDIDETSPIFLFFSLLGLGPFAGALLLAKLRPALVAALFAIGLSRVIGRIMVLTCRIAIVFFCVIAVQDLVGTLALCPSDASNTPCQQRWAGMVALLTICSVFFSAHCGRHLANASPDGLTPFTFALRRLAH